MKFVATKTAEQLDLQALHRVRERLVGQRTGVINQIRAFLLDRGVAVRQGQRFLRAELPRILAMPPSGEIEATARRDAGCERLSPLCGAVSDGPIVRCENTGKLCESITSKFGPLNALFLALRPEGDCHARRTARYLALDRRRCRRPARVDRCARQVGGSRAAAYCDARSLLALGKLRREFIGIAWRR